MIHTKKCNFKYTFLDVSTCVHSKKHIEKMNIFLNFTSNKTEYYVGGEREAPQHLSRLSLSGHWRYIYRIAATIPCVRSQ